MGDDILFKAESNGKDDLFDVQYEKYLKVHVGVPLPDPQDGAWHYGDAHYHTGYTDNVLEFGGSVASTVKVLAAIGLNRVTATDHASNYPDDAYWFYYQDLCAEAWDDRKLRASVFNDSSGLPLLLSKEIACQPVDGIPLDQIHLLAYDNASFVPGDVAVVNALHTLQSRMDLLNDGAFAFAAHPLDSLIVYEWSSILTP